MDERALIEAYYAVAADLKHQAEQMSCAAEMLAAAADKMSEAAIARQPVSASPGTKP